MALDALSAEIAGLDKCLPARSETQPEATPALEHPAPAAVAEDTDPERTRRNRALTPKILRTHAKSRGKTR